MANPIKGEVEFEADGVTYTLRFTVDAMCRLEEETGKLFQELAADLADPKRIGISRVRQVFWACLQDRHEGVTLKEAGELIAKAGGMAGAVDLISLAMVRAFPQEAKGTARPPKPGRVRTGPAS